MALGQKGVGPCLLSRIPLVVICVEPGLIVCDGVKLLLNKSFLVFEPFSWEVRDGRLKVVQLGGGVFLDTAGTGRGTCGVCDI